MRTNIVNTIFKIQITQQTAKQMAAMEEENMITNEDEIESALSSDSDRKTVRAQSSTQAHAKPIIGRNESCPCGSGKKYKKCHGKEL